MSDFPLPAAADQPSHERAALLPVAPAARHRPVDPGLGRGELKVAEQGRVLGVGQVPRPRPRPARRLAAGGGDLAASAAVRGRARVRLQRFVVRWPATITRMISLAQAVKLS